MQVVQMKLDDLIPYENNPRKNDNAVDKVAESIREFGFKVPVVVDKNNVIVAGHTRVKAAEQLGLDTVPVIVADDLNDEQIRAFRLADNKTAEFSHWDFTLLEEELEQIRNIDMEEFGFNSIEEQLDEFSDHEEKENGYSIVYEIAFNDETEKEQWYDFLKALKDKYPDVDTISERILLATNWWLDNNE